jgi:hypothetical protein
MELSITRWASAVEKEHSSIVTEGEYLSLLHVASGKNGSKSVSWGQRCVGVCALELQLRFSEGRLSKLWRAKRDSRYCVQPVGGLWTEVTRTMGGLWNEVTGTMGGCWGCTRPGWLTRTLRGIVLHNSDRVDGSCH